MDCHDPKKRLRNRLVCESPNHRTIGAPKQGCRNCTFKCPFCGHVFCYRCEGTASDDDPFELACDDCWAAMNSILEALEGERWTGYPEEDDPDDFKRIHDGRCTGLRCPTCRTLEAEARDD